MTSITPRTPIGGHFTPLKLARWKEELESYPDKQVAELLLRGIEHGFRVGFDTTRVALKPKLENLISAAEHPGVVSDYLKSEIRAGRVHCVGSSEEALQLGVHGQDGH